MNLAEPTTSASSRQITTTVFIIPFPRWLYKQTEIKKEKAKPPQENLLSALPSGLFNCHDYYIISPINIAIESKQKKSGASTPKCMLPLKAVLFQSVAMIPYLCYNASEPVTARMRRSWCFFIILLTLAKRLSPIHGVS